MPFNGAGLFTSLGAPTYPAVTGDPILASYFNLTLGDVFLGLSSCLPKDGQASMAANLPMGGFKLTGVGAGTVAGDALMYGQAGAVLAGLTVNTTFAMTGTMTAVAGTLDLTGATAVNVPLQLVNDDSNKAASTAFVQDFFLTMPSGTLPSVTGKSLYNLRVNAGETGVEWALVPPPTIVRTPRTSNTILVAADQGTLIDITSGTFSQTFTAAATLGSGWFVYIKNSGTGTITLDPDGAELINGATTFELPTLATVLLQCTGTAFTVITAAPNIIKKLVIFSTAATATDIVAMSSGETLENSMVACTGLTTTSAVKQIIFGNSLFIASHGYNISASAVSSSPDGLTWTSRAMPSAAVWSIGTDGTAKFIAVVPGATTTASSTDGTTWVAGTALPAASLAAYARVVFVGVRGLVISNTASTAYWSDDNAATWTSATLPSTVTAASGCFSIGGLFWYHNATTVAYTSATGATGAWTSRTLPVTPSLLWQDTDGSLWIGASGGLVFYRTTDGINWTAQTAVGTAFGVDVGSAMPLANINGVYAKFSATWGVSGSQHNGVWVRRGSNGTDSSGTVASYGAKNVAGTIFVLPSSTANGSVIRVAPAESTAKTAVFTA